MSCRWLLPLLLLAATGLVRADGPADNMVDRVRPIPPKGIALSAADRSALQAGVDELGKEIDGLRDDPQEEAGPAPAVAGCADLSQRRPLRGRLRRVLPVREIAVAKKLLEQGLERARQLREGHAPWNTATGLVVRGYVSKIDGSVQPYGLVVPASYRPDTPHSFRLDVWCHGRGENLSELSFIDGRQTSPGEFTPTNAFVLHPYGRYCNANKFAGEIDLFEALDDIKTHYPIDEDRLVMRGFSMGGAACWQFAVHYPSIWAAAAPGAGFSETADFLKVFQRETVQPTWYEQKLWHLYDCTDYAINLYNCPTVAYSGEKDRQKQAADMMAKALKEEGIEMVHVIGANARPSLHPRGQGRDQSTDRSVVRSGRNPVTRIHFTTWTLRYNRRSGYRSTEWSSTGSGRRVDGRSRIRSKRTGAEARSKHPRNVSALTLAIPGLFNSWDIFQEKPNDDRRGSRRITQTPLRPLLDGPFPQGRGALDLGPFSRRRHPPQAARPARADRRRLHGQLPDGPADRPGA